MGKVSQYYNIGYTLRNMIGRKDGDLVKTGHFHELAPYDEDWFYTRAAAIMRKLYVKPTVGIGRLANKFGGKQRNGVARKHHAKSSRGVIRACMKALEGAKLLTRYNDKSRNDFAEETRPESDTK